MKQRFTSFDLFAVVKELQPILEHARLTKLYDHPSSHSLHTYTCFLLKFTSKQHKCSLIIESGVRMHRTLARIDHAHVLPGGFAAKLRKHLKGRRVLGIEQLGFDRVVRLRFAGTSKGQLPVNLYLEFFAAGNIVLTECTDEAEKIIAISRPVELKDAKLAVGESYKCTPAQLPELCSVFPDKASMKKALTGVFHGGLLEYLAGRGLLSMQSIMDHLAEGPPVITHTANGDLKDFAPHPLGTVERIQHFGTFNEAIDAYFASIMDSMEGQRQVQLEEEARRKLAAIQLEQQGRIHGLEQQAHGSLLKAQAIEANLVLVEEALTVCRVAVESGMDWRAFDVLLGEERRKGTLCASIIDGLDFHRDTVRLVLHSNKDTNEEVVVKAEVNVSLSAHANATAYYAIRKQQLGKLARTIKANRQAIRSAEAKIRLDQQQRIRSRARIAIRHAERKTWWFERFAWFVSSDGYLVLAGRDAQQNELLVKRYLRKQDLYVHADISGAGSIIIRNHSNDGVIPPRTLQEAACASLCQSRAWQAKIVTSAWWVRAEQVSKTAPSGEFLTTGSFMIRGQKNFLPPSSMIYGLTFMFIADEHLREQCKAGRLAHAQEESGEEELAMKTERYLRMIDTKVEEEQIDIESNNEVDFSESSESEENEDQEQGKYIESDMLVGNPPGPDHVLYAIPMCAPYAALQKHLLKVKLTPAGTGQAPKKGRLVKTALTVMLSDKNLDDRLRDMIKRVPENDIIACIPADSKLTSGSTAIEATRKAKQDKKVAAKQSKPAKNSKKK